MTSIHVRYFAAARAAAQCDSDDLTLDGVSVSIADVELALVALHPGLSRVLPRCSYLADAIAVTTREALLASGTVVDVLPPFAGG